MRNEEQRMIEYAELAQREVTKMVKAGEGEAVIGVLLDWKYPEVAYLMDEMTQIAHEILQETEGWS